MWLTSVSLFFLYFWGFGLAAVKLAKAKEAGNFLERQMMRTGIGAAFLMITAIILNIARIPLDWRIFLALALAAPAFYLSKNFKTVSSSLQQIRLRIKKSDINILPAIIIFLASFYMYASGSFSYPYLEDDDPWSHAEGVKYIAVEKTFRASEYRGFAYMNPYPPSYDFIFGLMHQTENSIYWTIKFFNALIISLSLIYFYFFAAEFIGNRNKALFATAVLAAVPAYMSHFIWAPALAMTAFFPALYALERIKHDKRWKWIAAIAIGGLLVSHPTSTLTLFLMIIIYLFIKFLAERDWKAYATSAIGGMTASLSWWGFHGKSFMGGVVTSAVEIGGPTPTTEGASIFAKLVNAFLKVFYKWSGTASRPYTFSDFFVAKGQNMINNPVGIGIAVMALLIAGLVAAPILSIKRLSTPTKAILIAVLLGIFVYTARYQTQNFLAFMAVYSAIMILVMFFTKAWKEKLWFFTALVWFLLTFTIVNNLTFDLPIGFFAFRTWMMLAVPVALIATEGLWSIFLALPLFKIDKKMIPLAKIAIAVVVLAGIFATSAQQKYEVNTAIWPPGAFWTSNEEISAYLWLKTLPVDTKVFSFFTDGQVISMDKFVCGWCEAEAKYRETGLDDTPAEMSAWMKRNGYEYLIIGGLEVRKFGQNRTVNKINELATSGFFEIAYQTSGAIVLKAA